MDALHEGMSEGILDHARQQIDRVLGETSLVENLSLSIMITS